jgi:hypothetical protein
MLSPRNVEDSIVFKRFLPIRTVGLMITAIDIVVSSIIDEIEKIENTTISDSYLILDTNRTSRGE